MARIEELIGTTWHGSKRLWLDPEAPARLCDATIAVGDGVVRYTWSYEGRPQQGEVAWRRTEAGLEGTFRDTWHQTTAMACAPFPSAALLAVQGTYPAPPGPDWHWRILLFVRPPQEEGGEPELVLQMINVYPWGEEQRAVQIAGRQAP